MMIRTFLSRLCLLCLLFLSERRAEEEEEEENERFFFEAMMRSLFRKFSRTIFFPLKNLPSKLLTTTLSCCGNFGRNRECSLQHQQQQQHLLLHNIIEINRGRRRREWEEKAYNTHTIIKYRRGEALVSRRSFRILHPHHLHHH